MRAAVYSFSLRGAELSKKVGELLHNLGYEVQVETLPKYAEEAKLPVAQKKDSMEICFIPDNDYASFIDREAGGRVPGPGNFVTKDGTVVGQHKGITHYTIGQRKGLLAYLKEVDIERYRSLIERLGLRK